jgi:L-fuculose-phosphate aldolase
VKPLHEVKNDVVAVCRKLDAREYVGGRDGNVSARVSASTIVVTRAGVRKGDVSPEDLLLVDREGRRLAGRGEASTETAMHLKIYELRSDVHGVVHAHPPVATGYAAAGAEIGECVLPEVILGLGRVPLVRYATPGTPALAESLQPLLAAHDALLLENHGVVTVGAEVGAAHQKMETVEHAARILLAARLLGGPNQLAPEQVRELLEARPRYGVREGLAACGPLPELEPDDALIDEIVTRVRQRLGS